MVAICVDHSKLLLIVTPQYLVPNIKRMKALIGSLLVSATISYPVSFPIYTLSITFSVINLMMCSSSSSKKV